MAFISARWTCVDATAHTHTHTHTHTSAPRTRRLQVNSLIGGPGGCSNGAGVGGLWRAQRHSLARVGSGSGNFCVHVDFCVHAGSGLPRTLKSPVAGEADVGLPMNLPRETCPISTEGWTRRVHFVREGGGGGGGGGGNLSGRGPSALRPRLVSTRCAVSCAAAGLSALRSCGRRWERTESNFTN